MEKQQVNNNNMTVRECLFGITMRALLVLISIGFLEPIVCKKTAYRKNNHKNSTNGYFRIAGTNLVWMHVQDGYGVIINEFITTRSEKRINLVEVLSKYYWYIENTSNIIKAHELDNKPLYRCIMSIILYDDIKDKMPKWLEVHHKWWKWCNTQHAITKACKKKHNYFHNYVGSRKSHQQGVLICSVKDMLQWRYAILAENPKLKLQDM